MPKKIDNISYVLIDNFLNSEIYENDVIIIQRFIHQDPKFHDKLKNNKVFVWVHDLTNFPVFIAQIEAIDYYIANPQSFKGYLSQFIINNHRLNFVFPSDFAKLECKRFLSKYDEYLPDSRLHTIHNILYDDDFKHIRHKPTDINLNKIVFASSWTKNIASIIQLFEYIHMRNKDYVLVFMEHGFDKNEHYESEMRRKFGRNVEILGAQSKENYAQIVKSSLCLLISTFAETFGCVCTESLYLGTPVIADPRSGAVTDFIDPSYVLDYDNP